LVSSFFWVIRRGFVIAAFFSVDSLPVAPAYFIFSEEKSFRAADFDFLFYFLPFTPCALRSLPAGEAREFILSFFFVFSFPSLLVKDS